MSINWDKVAKDNELTSHQLEAEVMDLAVSIMDLICDDLQSDEVKLSTDFGSIMYVRETAHEASKEGGQCLN